MSEKPSLKRDGTMVVTAQAGKEFLESHGMTITDDDVKTRGQKEKLDEISALAPEQNSTDGAADEEEEEEEEEEKEESGPPPPKIPRDGTMVVTAKEAEKLLAGEKLEKTRARTVEDKTKEAEKALKSPTLKSPRVRRSNTIAQTKQAGSLILGGGERGRTRSQTRKISESGEEERKPGLKRTGTMEQTIKDAEEFLGSDAKKTKIDNGSEKVDEPLTSEKIPEVDETLTTEKSQAEA